MLVGGLGQACLVGLLSHSLAVGDHWITDNEVALGILILQVLQANLNMQLTASGNHVLSAFLSSAHHQWIGLGELLQTLHQFGQVLAILGLHCNLHNRGHTVLHVSDVVGVLERGDGS